MPVDPSGKLTVKPKNLGGIAESRRESEALGEKSSETATNQQQVVSGSSAPPAQPLKPAQKPQRRAQEPGKAKEKDSPPSSPEIEKVALSCILYGPEKGFSTFERTANERFFTWPAQDWYRLMRAFYRDKGILDPVVFIQFVLDNPNIFNPIGGHVWFATELQAYPQHPDVLPVYIEQLREKYLQRAVQKFGFAIAGEATAAAKNPTQDSAKMLASIGQWYEDLKRAAGGPNGMENFGLDDLRAFDAAHDVNCLVGYRWLVRGGSCLMAGSAGVGKSTLAIQIALYWANGSAVFGVRPHRPLKSMILQAEDDKGDVAEQYQGVCSGIAAAGDLDLQSETIDKNLIILRCSGYSGEAFLGLLDQASQFYRPDLIWINPLFSFAGCDLMNAKETGRFLREGLFPIATKRGACIIVMHHVGKPPKEDKGDVGDLDLQYLSFGTSEIQNAFRAINIIQRTKTAGVYRLSFSKRGERAGAKTPSGERDTHIFMKHSKEGLFWMQVEDPGDPEPKPKGRQAKFTIHVILQRMDRKIPVRVGKLQKDLQEEEGMSHGTFFTLWDSIKQENLVIKTTAGWIRNEPESPESPESPTMPF